MKNILSTLACAVAFTACAEKTPLLDKDGVFNMKAENGEYMVKATVKGLTDSAEITIKAESRRMFFHNVKLAKGDNLFTFVVNKHDTLIDSTAYTRRGQIKIKPRERGKLDFDDKLTLEFLGKGFEVTDINAELIPAADSIPVIYLCGNSTVVDQEHEPWASWGQMLPCFLNSNVSVANFAESGESSNTFIAARRLARIESTLKKGDYLVAEFGHNDEKQKGENKGAYKHYWNSLKHYIKVARERGATPILVTPTQRRNFVDGVLVDTHGEFPEACRKLAEEEGVALIDLTEQTTLLYNAFGDEGSKQLLVHYPANTFPGQEKEFADNTHFNAFGAYEIAKIIATWMKNNTDMAKYVKSDFKDFDASKPDSPADFNYKLSNRFENVKPDGN